MTIRARAAALAAAAVLLALLAACTPEAPAPTTPSAPSTPTPSPTPAADSGPAPRVPLDCSTVVDPGTLRALIGDGAPLVEVPLQARLSPDHAAGTQLGSLDCRWTDGSVADQWTGPRPDAPVAELRILPEGLDAAIAYVDLYQIADPTYGEHVQGPRCLASPSLSGNPGFCELTGVIGQTWVELHVNGIVADYADDAELLAAFRSVTDPMVAQLQPMAPAARWESPDATPIDCAAMASPDEVIAITGLPSTRLATTWDGPRVGQYVWTTEETGAKGCRVVLDSSEASFGGVDRLPGGAWAFERYSDEWVAAGAVEAVVPGVADGDALMSGCDDPTARCRIDLRIDDDWVRVWFPPVPPEEVAAQLPTGDYAAARASVLPFAELVASRVAAG